MPKIVGILVLSVIVNAQGTLPDLSGTWNLESELVTQPGRQGSRPSVVTGTSPVTITHTATELRIEGARGFWEGTAPVEIYRLDGSKGTFVQDFGDWWRKSETQLSVSGTSLTMRLRVIAGYYSSHSPDEEKLERPHGDNTRVVTLSDDRNTMTVQTTTVKDGAAPGPTATQVFRRSAPQTQNIPSFSGTWTTSRKNLTVLDAVNYTPRGWSQFIEGLRRAQTYSLSIMQATDRMTILFPGESKNFLTASFLLNGAEEVSCATWATTGLRH